MDKPAGFPLQIANHGAGVGTIVGFKVGTHIGANVGGAPFCASSK